MKQAFYLLLCFIFTLFSCKDKTIPPEPTSQVDHLIGVYKGTMKSRISHAPSPPTSDSFYREVAVTKVAYNKFNIETIDLKEITFNGDKYEFSHNGVQYTVEFYPQENAIYILTQHGSAARFEFNGTKSN